MESPSLKDQKPKIFDDKNSYSNPDSITKNRESELNWFRPTIKNKGRMYVIPKDENSNYGVVVIDDVENIVYVTVSHS